MYIEKTCTISREKKTLKNEIRHCNKNQISLQQLFAKNRSVPFFRAFLCYTCGCMSFFFLFVHTDSTLNSTIVNQKYLKAGGIWIQRLCPKKLRKTQISQNL